MRTRNSDIFDQEALGVKAKDLAAQYGLSRSRIYQIITRELRTRIVALVLAGGCRKSGNCL